jgi:ubiquinone/menaquinone biosynthesis C-methylase UbiE
MKNYLHNSFDFGSLTDLYDELPLWSAPFGLKLLEHIEYKKNLTVLDIGFGNGFPLTELAMRLGNSSVVYGIDPWKAAIDRVNRKTACYGIPNIKIIEGVAESIPLENNSVDLITSNNGINNIRDKNQVFSECSRIARKGGQFIQTMNLDMSMYEFYGQMERVLDELQLRHEIDLMHDHIASKRPSLNAMVALIEKHGFVIRDLEHDQFDYRFADGTALLSHYFIRLAFMDSWIQLLPPEKTEQVFDAIESRLNEQSRILGGIKLSIPFVMINAVKN